MATSILTIEEITGKKRRLDLIGAGLPLKGAQWGGQTVLATTWNAGNPEATQHVLSPQEDPSPWEGKWSTTMLIASPCLWNDSGSAQKIVIANELDAIFESLRLSAQLLRVTWSSEQAGRQFQKVRIGRLQAYIGKFDTQDDLSWNATFEWISRGNPPRTLGSPQDDILAATRAAIIVQNGVVATISTNAIRASRKIKNQTTQFRLGDLEAMTQAPLAALDSFARAADSFSREMQDLGNIILKTRAIPFQLANRALATATNAVAISNQFLDEISRKAPEQLTVKQSAALFAQTAAYYGSAQSQAQLMLSINQQLSQQARVRRSGIQASSTPGKASSMSQSDVLALYIPRDGDTFALLAQRYYQSGDLGSELASVNGYSRYAISPPRRVALVIPVRSVIDARIAAGL